MRGYVSRGIFSKETKKGITDIMANKISKKILLSEVLNISTLKIAKNGSNKRKPTLGFENRVFISWKFNFKRLTRVQAMMQSNVLVIERKITIGVFDKGL